MENVNAATFANGWRFWERKWVEYFSQNFLQWKNTDSMILIHFVNSSIFNFNVHVEKMQKCF